MADVRNAVAKVIEVLSYLNEAPVDTPLPASKIALELNIRMKALYSYLKVIMMADLFPDRVFDSVCYTPRFTDKAGKSNELCFRRVLILKILASKRGSVSVGNVADELESINSEKSADRQRIRRDLVKLCLMGLIVKENSSYRIDQKYKPLFTREV